VVKVLNARGAQCVTAVNQDAGNALANVVFAPAELADIKLTRTVIKV